MSATELNSIIYYLQYISTDWSDHDGHPSVTTFRVYPERALDSYMDYIQEGEISYFDVGWDSYTAPDMLYFLDDNPPSFTVSTIEAPQDATAEEPAADEDTGATHASQRPAGTTALQNRWRPGMSPDLTVSDTRPAGTTALQNRWRPGMSPDLTVTDLTVSDTRQGSVGPSRTANPRITSPFSFTGRLSTRVSVAAGGSVLDSIDAPSLSLALDYEDDYMLRAGPTAYQYTLSLVGQEIVTPQSFWETMDSICKSTITTDGSAMMHWIQNPTIMTPECIFVGYDWEYTSEGFPFEITYMEEYDT